ncbi:unnamed protein product, partial [Closterium sp. NIES-54]
VFLLVPNILLIHSFLFLHSVSNNTTFGSSRDNIGSSRNNIGSSRDNIGSSRNTNNTYTTSRQFFNGIATHR